METRFTARRRAAIVLALSLSAFLISVDVTIVNVALPTLVRALGATTTQLQWVVDAYSLVFAALVLAAGSLSDRQGRKGMLLAGLAVFAAGSRGGGARQHDSGTHRGSRRDGTRRGPHVPLHPVAAGERLHRAGRAGEGHRAVGGDHRGRDRHRAHRGRMAAGAFLVGEHLRFHGRGGRRHRGAGGPGRAHLAGSADPAGRLAGLRSSRRLPWPSSSWASSRPPTGGGGRPRRCRRWRRAWRSWSCSFSWSDGPVTPCWTWGCFAIPASPRRAGRWRSRSSPSRGSSSWSPSTSSSSRPSARSAPEFACSRSQAPSPSPRSWAPSSPSGSATR